MKQWFLIVGWLLSDLCLFVGWYALAYFLRVGWIFSTDFSFARYITVVLLTAPLWLLTLATTRTFTLTQKQQTLRNGAYIAYTAVVGTALFALMYYFFYGLFFSRLLLLYALILTTLGIWGWHILSAHTIRFILNKKSIFPTLIVGLTRESRNLIHTLQRTKNPLHPIAILDAHSTMNGELVHGLPVLGKLNKLEETLIHYSITHLIQCSDLEQSLNLLSACRSRGITYLLLPSVLGIVERDEHIESLEGQPVTVVSPKGPWWEWFFR